MQISPLTYSSLFIEYPRSLDRSRSRDRICFSTMVCGVSFLSLILLQKRTILLLSCWRGQLCPWRAHGGLPWWMAHFIVTYRQFKRIGKVFIYLFMDVPVLLGRQRPQDESIVHVDRTVFQAPRSKRRSHWNSGKTAAFDTAAVLGARRIHKHNRKNDRRRTICRVQTIDTETCRIAQLDAGHHGQNRQLPHLMEKRIRR